MSAISSIGSTSLMSMASQRSQAMATRLLSKADTDGSTSVDSTELKALFSDIQSKTGVTLDAEKLFGSMDTDGNGNLSGSELSQGLQSVMPPPPSTMAFAQGRGQSKDDLFNKVDRDGSGSVDTDEMTAFTEHMSAGSDGPEVASFRTLDSDGDGSLSQAEFDAGRPQANREGASTPPRGAQGVGGPPPMGGPDAAAGASASSSESADSSTYDPLDTNQDGVVSEMERLAGALKDYVEASTAEASNTESSNSTLVALARQLYEQIASGDLNRTTNGKASLNTTA